MPERSLKLLETGSSPASIAARASSGVSRFSIEAYVRRVGNDLVITSISGEVVTIREFFSSFDGHKSDLVLDDDKGGLWLTGFGEGQGELALNYSAVSYTHLTLPTNREV